MTIRFIHTTSDFFGRNQLKEFNDSRNIKYFKVEVNFKKRNYN